MPDELAYDAGVETCGNGHPRTKENTYRRPVSGKLECAACRTDNATRNNTDRPSNRKPGRAPLDPAVVAQLRAAAGLPPDGASCP